jgi:predicted enzyme related to lactoylglutathione lyase
MSESVPSGPATSYKPPPTKAIAFLSIPAQDETRAQKFYEQVFGWNFWAANKDSPTVFFTGGDVMGRISKEEKVAQETDGAVGGECMAKQILN